MKLKFDRKTCQTSSVNSVRISRPRTDIISELTIWITYIAKSQNLVELLFADSPGSYPLTHSCSVPILNASTNFPHVKYGEFSVPAVVFSVPIIPLFLMGTVSVMLGGINTTGWGSLKWYNVWQGVATKKTSCPFPLRAINNNRSLIQSLFNALHVYSFSLSGFRNLAENARCLAPPCCFSSSRSASFLSPEIIWRIHRFEFRNLTGTSQGGCRNLSLAFQREATQFLMAKNFTVNNLQACHLPLTLWRTWC